MKNNTVTLTLLLLITSATCSGQTSFQGLTPGESTRNDVARVLGQPVRTLSATLFEFAPPAGLGKVEVEYVYDGQTHVVRRIEVYLLKPISHSALMQKFSLSQQAATKQTNTEGKLVQSFAGPSLLVFTYATGEESSGVTSIGYYSREVSNSAKAALPSSPLALSGSVPPPKVKESLPSAGNTSVNPSGDSSVGSGTSWTIPSDFVLIVQMTSSITSKTAKPGDQITGQVIAAVSANGKIIIPAGSVVAGQVTEATPAKRMSRAGMIAVDFNELVFANGSRVKIVGTLTSASADDRRVIDREGRVSKDGTKRSIVFIGSGTGAGVALGALSGGKAVAIGAAAGAAAGVAVVMLMKGPEAELKNGLRFGFQLSKPLIVRESFLGEKQ